MADYYSRFTNEILKFIAEESEAMTTTLVSSREMPDNDVHWHRGGIEKMRQITLFIQNELPKIVNKE